MKTGKCPGCKKTLMSARFDAIPVHEGIATTSNGFKGVSFSCPSCHCVLGVGVDPFALKADIVAEVVNHLRQGS